MTNRKIIYSNEVICSNTHVHPESDWGQAKWDNRFLDMAEFVAAWSKDPSTKVGCVIADRKKIVSLGYNGFPAGVKDTPERYEDREIKYMLVQHAEQNALDSAAGNTQGHTLYCTQFTCIRCAMSIISLGIKRVVTLPPDLALMARHGVNIEFIQDYYNEAFVHLDIYE